MHVDDIAARLEAYYGTQGQVAANKLRLWLADGADFSYWEEINASAEAGDFDLILDSFWRDLSFGTGGRRGQVGYGPNRINGRTIARTVQGHANFLRLKHGDSNSVKVVVANDVREFADIAKSLRYIQPDSALFEISSRSMARLSAEIYAANGITAYIQEPDNDLAVLTTPELSFAIRYLGAEGGGINLSASHNPPDDNGIKLYDHAGAQLVPPVDDELALCIAQVASVSRRDFAQGLAEGAVVPLPTAVHARYLDLYRELSESYNLRFTGEFPVVYTPLCGCGESTVADVLTMLGADVRVPLDQKPDGSFAVVPYRAPNPEVREATAPARLFAQTLDSQLVLSSDPDADRIGVDVRTGGGEWVHLNGNEIAVLVSYFLMLDPEGPRLKGLVVTTTVTTRAVTKIAEAAGCAIVDDLLVGFKYVAEVLQTLENKGAYHDFIGAPEDLVFAAEESHGGLATSDIRDKDCVSPAVVIVALHERLVRSRLDLVDYLLRVYAEIGFHAEVGRSLVMRGKAGVDSIDALMRSLRSEPPVSFGGRGVLSRSDYLDEQGPYGPVTSESDRLSRNVLAYECSDFRVVMRPSGTEPKFKFYVHTLASGSVPSLNAAKELAEEAAGAVYDELLRRLGVTLSITARDISDLVAVDEKQKFDEVLPQLVDSVRMGESISTFEDQLVSLGRSMFRGADSLDALKAVVSGAIETRRDVEFPDSIVQWSKSSSGGLS